MIRFTLCAALAVFAVDSGPATVRRADFPPLESRMESGWQRYVVASERRMLRETGDATRFLAMDFAPSAASDRQTVTSGEPVVARMPETVGADGRAIEIPDAWLHHWRGAILLRNATLDGVFARLQESVPKSSDVLASRILGRTPEGLRVFLRIQRSQSLAGLLNVTLVYNTEHAVSFARPTAGRGLSTSIATRIAQVYEAGTPIERELKPGEDHGFLWRWNSYWRYQQTPAGVIAECEVLSLSRSAPFLVRFIASQLAEGAATESMTRALNALRDHMAASHLRVSR